MWCSKGDTPLAAWLPFQSVPNHQLFRQLHHKAEILTWGLYFLLEQKSHPKNKHVRECMQLGKTLSQWAQAEPRGSLFPFLGKFLKTTASSLAPEFCWVSLSWSFLYILCILLSFFKFKVASWDPTYSPYICVHAQMFGHVWFFATPWTVALQAALSRGWDSPGKNTGVDCPALFQGVEPKSPALQQILYYWVPPGKLPHWSIILPI